MTASKSLPARPSLDSLRKQAKKLARETAAGDAGALARARVHLPNIDGPLTQRNAQLVIAREYGYAGWQDLAAEVSRRVGRGLEWAAMQARRVIHDNDVERLQQLLGEYPALLTWRDHDNDGGLLGMATGSFGDSFNPSSEEYFTRAACAELLIDAGAVVMPSVCEGIIESRARGLLQLFHRKGLLPRTLTFHAALGDIESVRQAVRDEGNNLAAVSEAFLRACAFEHEAVASVLLERSIVLDARLGTHVDESGGRAAFIKHFIDNGSQSARDTPAGLWKLYVKQQLMQAVDGDLPTFVSTWQREPWLLGDACVPFQIDVIERATLHDRGEFITALLDLDPALLRRQPPPKSQAIVVALTYAKPHLLPLLTRVWPLPDDLPHAAATGNLLRVKQWFDESGAPALGDLAHHFPCNDPHERAMLLWGAPSMQQVLDTGLGWSVVNRHFDVADFLLAHGADINTNWASHEPASILHELVGQVATGENPEGNYESMQFLIDRGIDMTIKDYRWNGTARGWAFYAARNEKLAAWLEDAERQRTQSD